MEPVTDLDDYRLTQQDALIHRCTCGSWRFHLQECGTCGRMPNAEHWEIKRLALIEDVEWCLDTGEQHVETISHRCGTTPAALERRLARAGRHDLIERMTKFTGEGRRVA